MRNDTPAPPVARAAIGPGRLTPCPSVQVDDFTFLQQLRTRMAAQQPADRMPPTRRTVRPIAKECGETRRIDRRGYAQGRSAASKRKTNGARKGFEGALRPGSRLAVDRPLLCGNHVLEAGTEATVEAVFPKLRIRGDFQDGPATVDFDDAADVTRRIPTIELAAPVDIDPASISFDVTVLDD